MKENTLAGKLIKLATPYQSSYKFGCVCTSNEIGTITAYIFDECGKLYSNYCNDSVCLTTIELLTDQYTLLEYENGSRTVIGNKDLIGKLVTIDAQLTGHSLYQYGIPIADYDSHGYTPDGQRYSTFITYDRSGSLWMPKKYELDDNYRPIRENILDRHYQIS